MEDFKALVDTVIGLLQLKMTIWGFTFSFWNILLFGLVTSIILWFLGGFYGHD